MTDMQLIDNALAMLPQANKFDLIKDFGLLKNLCCDENLPVPIYTVCMTVIFGIAIAFGWRADKKLKTNLAALEKRMFLLGGDVTVDVSEMAQEKTIRTWKQKCWHYWKCWKCDKAGCKGKLADLSTAFRQDHTIIGIINPIPLEQIFFTRPQRILCYYCELQMALAIVAIFYGLDQTGSLAVVKMAFVSVLSALFMIPISHVVPWMFQVAQTITSFTILENERFKREFKKARTEAYMVDEQAHYDFPEMTHHIVEMVELEHLKHIKPKRKREVPRGSEESHALMPIDESIEESIEILDAKSYASSLSNDREAKVDLTVNTADEEKFDTDQSASAKGKNERGFSVLESLSGLKSPLETPRRLGPPSLVHRPSSAPRHSLLASGDSFEIRRVTSRMPQKENPSKSFDDSFEVNRVQPRVFKKANPINDLGCVESDMPPKPKENAITIFDDSFEIDRVQLPESTVPKKKENPRKYFTKEEKMVILIQKIVRGKQGRNHVLRLQELEFFKNKLMTSLRYVLITIVYSLVGFFTFFCMYLNIIYGIKFSLEEQKQWMIVTHLTIFFEITIYTPSTIILKWLLPPYVTECFFILCFVLVIIFGAYCGDILDTERRSWSDNLNIFCDILPA